MIQELNNTLTVVFENDEITTWMNILNKLRKDLGKIGFNKKFSKEEEELIVNLINKDE